MLKLVYYFSQAINMQFLKNNVQLVVNYLIRHWRDFLVIILGFLFLVFSVTSFFLLLGTNIPLVSTPQISSLKDKITVSLSFTTALFAMTSFAINLNTNFKKNKLDTDFMRSKYFDLKFDRFSDDRLYKEQYDYLVDVVKDMASLYGQINETKMPILILTERPVSENDEYFSFLNDKVLFLDIENYEKKNTGKKLNIRKKISKVFSQVHQDSLLFEGLIKSYNLKINTESQKSLDTNKYHSSIFMDYYKRDDDYQAINYQIILEMWQVLLINQKFGEMAYKIIQSASMLTQYSRNFSINKIELEDVNYIFNQIEKNNKILNFMFRSKPNDEKVTEEE